MKHKALLLVLILLPYLCSTMHMALNWVYFSQAVDENELPGGAGLLYSLTHLSTWIEGAGDTFFCLNILMADCLFVSHLSEPRAEPIHTEPNCPDLALLDSVEIAVDYCLTSNACYLSGSG